MHVAVYMRVLKIFTIILACGYANVSAARSPLRLGVNSDWPPYSAQNEQDQPTGVFIDVLEEAFIRRLGIPLELVSLPWARVQAYVRDRTVEGMVTVPTRARLQYLTASNNVFSFSLNVYVNNESLKHGALAEVADLRDLAPYEGCEINGNRSAIEPVNLLYPYDLERIHMFCRNHEVVPRKHDPL